MGLFDFFRRVREKRPAAPQQKPEVTRAKTVQVRKKRPRQKPPKLEHKMLREWRTEVQKLQEHPLTQAKIVNEKLLAAVMDLLNEINSKLDELNTRVGQLETLKTKQAKEAPEVKLSTNEQKVIDFVKKKKEVVANEVASSLKISRSNAALKLNKLFSVGLLEKRQDGKDVYYKIA